MNAPSTIFRYLKPFLLFWRNFLIGDDWWGAGITLVGLGFTYLALYLGMAAFWVPVVFVSASLGQNLWRRKRREGRNAGESVNAGQTGNADESGSAGQAAGKAGSDERQS